MTISAVPAGKWNDRKFHFDPSKPRWVQIMWLSIQLFWIFGGMVLALVSLFMYPMLLTGAGYAIMYLGPLAVGIVIGFFITPRTWLPADMPVLVKIQVRCGVGLFLAAWFIGIFGIVNGYATPIVVRDAPMVYRRTTTPSDPHHMTYYVGTRVWPSSRDVYEITVRPALFASLDAPVTTQWHIPQQQLFAMPDHGLLRLAVGRGRLGFDWLKGVVGVVSSSSADRNGHS